MITAEEAGEFAREWVEAWNAHDLARVPAHSVVVYYRGHRGPVAEVFTFGHGGKVRSACANYSQ